MNTEKFDDLTKCDYTASDIGGKVKDIGIMMECLDIDDENLLNAKILMLDYSIEELEHQILKTKKLIKELCN